MSIQRELIWAALVLLGIYLIISLSRDLLEVMSSRERLVREQQEVLEFEKQQQELAAGLNKVLSEEFIEKEAREKLLMGKPGEIAVVIPQEEKGGKDESQAKDEEELENWQKWFKVFGFL